MLTPQPLRIIRFGVFEFDAETGELWNAGRRVRLQEQARQVLLMLVTRPGQLVTREEVRAALWPHDTFVDFDAGVNVVVNKIRHVLRDSASSPRFIETLPRRGYRFIAPVSPSPVQDAPENGPIAVLPFANLTSGGEGEHFAEGLAEDIISLLAKLPGLRVVARTSAFAFESKEDVRRIGEVLHVSTVLEGSVRMSERRIRVTAKLVDAAHGFHLWAERYDRDIRDVFDIQDEIAQAIFEKLKGPLLGGGRKRQRPKNFETYNAHLKGRYYWNRRSADDLRKAIACFQQAIAADPDYAPAYCGLADSYAVLGLHGMQSPRAIRGPATEAAEIGVRLDPTLAEAHASLGTVLTLYHWDWAAAGHAFERALELDPNSAFARYGYSRLLTCTGRVPNGLQQMRKALGLDPLSLMIATALGWTLLAARRYEEAIHELQSVLDMDAAFVWANIYLGWAYGYQGRFDAAVDALEKACRAAGGSTTALGELGRAHALAGNRTEALRILHQLQDLTRERYVAPIDIGRVFDGLGEREEALRCLEEAVDDRSVTLLLHRPHPVFATISSEPRFEHAMDRIANASSDASSRNPSIDEMREIGAGARGASRE